MFATVAVGIKTLFLKTLILPIITIHNESHLNRLLVHSDSSITGKWSHILPPLERIHETSHMQGSRAKMVFVTTTRNVFRVILTLCTGQSKEMNPK